MRPTCYADTHVDKKMLSGHDFGFNDSEAISVLNRENGNWWKKQLNHFNKVVYPNLIKNKTVEDTEKFLKIKS